MRILVAILGLALLSGCEATQSAKQFGLEAQAAGEAYLQDNWYVRRQVREKNWQIINAEVDRLVAEDQFAEAQGILCRAYPPLVTLGTIRGSEEEVRALNALRATDLRVAGCGALSDFVPPPAEEIATLDPVASEPLE